MNKNYYYPQPNSHRNGKRVDKLYGAYKDSNKSLTHNNSFQDLDYSTPTGGAYGQSGHKSHRLNNNKKDWKTNDFEDVDNFNYMIYENKNWKNEKSSSYDFDDYSFSSRNNYPDGRSKHNRFDKRYDNNSNKSFDTPQSHKNRPRTNHMKGLIVKEVVVEAPVVVQVQEPVKIQEDPPEKPQLNSARVYDAALTNQTEDKLNSQSGKQSKGYYASKDDMFSNNSLNPSIYHLPNSPEAPKNKFNIPLNFVNQPDLSKPLIIPKSITTIDSVSALASKLNKDSSEYLPKSVKLAGQSKVTPNATNKLKVVDTIFIPQKFRNSRNPNSEVQYSQNTRGLYSASQDNEAILKLNDDNEQIEESYPDNMNFDFLNTEGTENDQEEIKVNPSIVQSLDDETTVCKPQAQNTEAEYKECNIENMTTEDNLDYHALKTEVEEILNISGCEEALQEDNYTQSIYELLMSLAEEEEFLVQENLIKGKVQGYDVNKVYTDMVSHLS